MLSFLSLVTFLIAECSLIILITKTKGREIFFFENIFLFYFLSVKLFFDFKFILQSFCCSCDHAPYFSQIIFYFFQKPKRNSSENLNVVIS